MKRFICTLLSLCSALLACTACDPVAEKKGRPTRVAECEVRNREDAVALLPVAYGDCLDSVVAAMETHAKADLPAAYLLRAERKDDPLDLLRAWNAAENDAFNRGRAQERLGLIKEAIQSYNDVVASGDDEWAEAAKARRDHLSRIPDPVDQWHAGNLEKALRERNRTAIQRIVQAFPAESIRIFERSNVLDLEAGRLFAQFHPDPYARAIVAAAERPRDRKALEQGIEKFRQEEGAAEAATLLKRAGNPLYLAAQYEVATSIFAYDEVMPLLDSIAPIATDNDYRELASRIHTLRAVVLEGAGQYSEALVAYDAAIAAAKGLATSTTAALTRRSVNYTTIGGPALGLRDFLRVVPLLPRVADLNARHHAYGAAATAASKLAYPLIALQLQNAAIEETQKHVLRSPGQKTRHHHAIALRARADLYVALGNDAAATTDLNAASSQLDSANLKGPLRKRLQMRMNEVHGQALLKQDPAAAVQAFTKAIAAAPQENATYRAILHERRAIARRLAGDEQADSDIVEALRILRVEAEALIDSTTRGKFEELWRPYFSRFQTMRHELIERRIAEDDVHTAFLHAEEARAFEPLQLLMQMELPPGFEKIDSTAALDRALATLPPDTVILHYLVLEDQTYTWALSRGGINLAINPAGKSQIEGWVADIHSALASGQDGRIISVMRAAYDGLFANPLRGSRHTRIVIVPDGPMHGLPFAALQSTRGEYLIDRASLAVAGSTSLYLHSLLRDAQFTTQKQPGVLIVGDPAIHPTLARSLELTPLKDALQEAKQLALDYPGATLLLREQATTQRFLDAAARAGIIHFAGHGYANPEDPWTSMLVLAPDGDDYGDLTAQKLLSAIRELQRTRLVILGACSTASGRAVGPEGIAPLVRPLIAARVPAVVGTLWDVGDDTSMKLLVSLHCHYRNGDDVAVALQHAQREMLRKRQLARTWASYQVVGYAGSPYERPAAPEKRHHEQLCTENSLHRPDGLHSQ